MTMPCTCHPGRLRSQYHAAECLVAKSFQPYLAEHQNEVWLRREDRTKATDQLITEHTVEFGRLLAAHHFKRWAEAGNDIAQCPYAIGTPEYAHWRRLEADWFDQRLNITVEHST